ncbi:SGNH/GDSL hydrolase family protein [Clostridium oryzae]|uniref:SGNH hydrolase-type esterase domain-containing protein n=1 Tax=Clostridium oryzae TaxID=1450648 RepID=A0A1V4IMX7_9CLOT|nr:SGNH/GDSL hydrolase family protein [Clostridium oryzae]OPJ61391.1 hypothetical protein CLORY_22570 [Clostridium oryzae]
MERSVQVGPRAPKDPTKQRKGFYIMIDSIIEATERQEGKPAQEIYLDDGRLANKAKIVGGIEDEDILKLLENSNGLHKLVHSIGISVMTIGEAGNIDFVLQNYGKIDKYGSGTVIREHCNTDGSELILTLEDYEWSKDDEVLGKFDFEFEKPGELAKVTVKLYLHDGFEIPEMTIDPPVEFQSPEYNAMLVKSMLNLGNNNRFKAAAEKARRGENVTIAYIGGSITQGAGAKPINTECYAYKSYKKFKELFGKGSGDNIHFVKAGVGGTASQLGMIRYDRDILRDGKVKPDIIIIEFAVNDAGDDKKGGCFESLVLKSLMEENKPAVILLFSVFANDWNLQDRLEPIGRYYNLPMVSLSDAIVKQFYLDRETGGVITKRQFFYDIYHPTNEGHRIMSDCLGYLFEQMDKKETDEADVLINKKPVIGNAFAGVKLLDKKDNTNKAAILEGGFTSTDNELQMVELDANPFGSPQFPYNWMRTPESGEDSFRMTIWSRSLLIIFKDSGRADFGKAEVYVDGKFVLTADPHINGWTHCNPVFLYDEESPSEHQIEVKMAGDSLGKYFTILGFGYTI